MNKIIVIGTTEAIVNLNKNGVPVYGHTETVLTLDTVEKEKEVMGLVGIGLIKIVNDKTVKQKEAEDGCHNEGPNVLPGTGNIKGSDKKEEPKKGGRPKGSKNKKSLAQVEKERVVKAENETQKMGNRVVVSTGDGIREGRMTRSVIHDVVESDKTKESIATMEKLQKEEKEAVLPDHPVDPSEIDPSEQMGRPAVVSSAQGEDKVEMKNSILPNSEENKARDPFIDTEGKDTDEDDFDNSFLKI